MFVVILLPVRRWLGARDRPLERARDREGIEKYISLCARVRLACSAIYLLALNSTKGKMGEKKIILAR
jgi:hypothetical protein